MPRKRSQLINGEKFAEFCQLQWRYGDHYPHVLLFQKLADELDWDRNQRAWVCLVYMAYYDDGSAWCALQNSLVMSGHSAPPANYPISKQRRNLYGGRIKSHFKDLFLNLELRGFVNSRAELNLNLSPYRFFDFVNVSTWKELIKRLEEVYGNGRWASYTTAEMLVDLNCCPRLVPDSYEITRSTGPRAGLVYLGMEPTEQSADYVRDYLEMEYDLWTPPQVLESMLCNWYRMCRGAFYAGHNIDRQQSRIRKAETVTGIDCSYLWTIRSKLFDSRVMGEKSGWSGIDRQRMKVYKQTGKVLRPHEARHGSD